jgi:hypothetical protein
VRSDHVQSLACSGDVMTVLSPPGNLICACQSAARSECAVSADRPFASARVATKRRSRNVTYPVGPAGSLRFGGDRRLGDRCKNAGVLRQRGRERDAHWRTR